MAVRDVVVGGAHAVRTALECAPQDVLELWLRRDAPGAVGAGLEALAVDRGVAVHHVAERTLDRLYGDTHHQGVVLRRRPPAPVGLESLLGTLAARAAAPLLLVLDAVQDPRNFGACLRAADGAGADAVMFPRDKSAPLGSVVAKAASGAIDTLTLAAVPNLAAALAALAEAGIWITGTAHDAPRELYDADLAAPCALVLGNEGAGLRRLTRRRCDALVRIPMFGRLGSLNVATAAAVCLFEARRQRRAG